MIPPPGRIAGIRVFLGLLPLLLVSCIGAPGYLIDIFPEMHYQESYRPQEPPRLPPPLQSVPIGGREIDYTFGEARNLSNPLSSTPETLSKAAGVFRANCSICHGPAGRGNGVMADRLVAAGATRPVDLAGDRARARTDGELFWLTTNGIGFMPRFGPLLTEDERWSLVHYVRALQR